MRAAIVVLAVGVAAGLARAAAGPAPVPANAPAADAKAPIPAELLERVRGYKEGDSLADVYALRDAIRAAMATPAGHESAEAVLIDLIRSKGVTVDIKRILARQFWFVGTARSVPAWAHWLDDLELADSARYALRTNPDPAAGEALRDVLATAKGKARVGLAQTLGARRDEKAVPALADLAKGDDRALSAAAVSALGRIGSESAATSLMALPPAVQAAPGDRPAGWADAVLACAEARREAGDAKLAEVLWAKLAADAGRPAHVRAAAIVGLARLDPARAEEHLGRVLASKDAKLIEAAAGPLMRALPDGVAAKVIGAELGKAGGVPALIAIEALAERGDPAAFAILAKAAATDDPKARAAALRGMGRVRQIPEGADVALATLASAAGAAKNSPERDAAAGALAQLPGAAVEPGLLRMLDEKDPAARAGALRGLGERNATGAIERVLTAAREDPEADVRAAAYAALGRLAGTDRLGVLTDLLVTPKDVADRSAAETAIVAVARKAEKPADVVAAIRAKLGAAPAPAKVALLRVLAAAGGPEALAAVRAAAADPDDAVRDAGVRALANWADPAAGADLLDVVKRSSDATHRTLALRGYLRLARLPETKAAERRAMLEQAKGAVSTAADRKLLLAALADGNDAASLQIALGFLEDAEVRPEAVAAVLRLTDALTRTDPAAAKRALAKLKEAGAGDPAVADRLRLLTLKTANIAPQGKASSPDGLQKDGAAGGDPAGIDGDPKTYWDKEDNKPLYRYVVTFDRPRAMEAISLVGFNHESFAPRDFDVIADGKVIKTVKAAAYKDNFYFEALPAGTTAKVIELRITAAYGPSPAIREFGIYEAAK